MTAARKHAPGHGEEKIVVKGARTHNLKNITVEMPRNTMIAVTGLSGSGKSSLAFDTIFAEGQRRYVESLSAYARQFLHKMQKPDVDEISGLSPAISIDQKSRSNNPRSTVATITEIYDYLRILFARVGKPHCLTCGRIIHRISQEEILNTILETVTTRATQAKKIYGVSISDAKIRVYAPVVVGRKGFGWGTVKDERHEQARENPHAERPGDPNAADARARQVEHRRLDVPPQREPLARRRRARR
jgi:excinuclease ABC subunit A